MKRIALAIVTVMGVSAAPAMAQKARKPGKVLAVKPLAAEVKLSAELAAAASVAAQAQTAKGPAQARMRKLAGKLVAAAQQDAKTVTSRLKAAGHTRQARKLVTINVLLIRADKELAKGGSLQSVQNYLLQSRKLTVEHTAVLTADIGKLSNRAAKRALIGEDGLRALIGEDGTRALIGEDGSQALIGKDALVAPKLVGEDGLQK